MWAEAVHDILSSRFWIFQVSIETYVFNVFLSLPGFKRGADPGMPEPSVLRWALWSGHVKISVFSHRQLLKMSVGDLFCLSVCSGDEDAPDGNYRPVHKLHEDSFFISSQDARWDLNSVLGCKYFTVTSTQHFCVILRLLLPLKHCIEKHTKCFLCLFLLNLWRSL